MIVTACAVQQKGRGKGGGRGAFASLCVALRYDCRWYSSRRHAGTCDGQGVETAWGVAMGRSSTETGEGETCYHHVIRSRPLDVCVAAHTISLLQFCCVMTC